MLLLLLVAAAVLVAALQQPDGAEASGHSATRAFASTSVAPGGQTEVTMTARNYGAFALVVETLPGGFRYVGSSLLDSAVSVGPNSVTFTLLGRERFTYTVQAPPVASTYTFSGFVWDQHSDAFRVGGDTILRVSLPPTPVPPPGPTAEATATPTPAPTAPAAATPTPASTAPAAAMPTPASTTLAAPTPTSMPAAVPTPAPAVTAAPVSAATPRPAADPTPGPTATPVPGPIATPTPGLVPIVEMPGEGGGSLRVVLLPLLGLALLLGCLASGRVRSAWRDSAR